MDTHCGCAAVEYEEKHIVTYPTPRPPLLTPLYGPRLTYLHLQVLLGLSIRRAHYPSVQDNVVHNLGFFQHTIDARFYSIQISQIYHSIRYVALGRQPFLAYFSIFFFHLLNAFFSSCFAAAGDNDSTTLEGQDTSGLPAYALVPAGHLKGVGNGGCELDGKRGGSRFGSQCVVELTVNTSTFAFANTAKKKNTCTKCKRCSLTSYRCHVAMQLLHFA